MKIEIKNNHFDKDTWLENMIYDLGVYDIENFLTLDESVLEKPDLYDNMSDGLELLKNSIKIGILSDCDVDGATSTTIMYQYAKKIGKNDIELFIHDGKQHGLSEDVFENIKTSDIDLLIIPDAGSGDYNEHKILSDIGIKVLVLDHHEAKKYSIHACVINNQLSEKVLNKSLSGVGVVYKFLEYCDRHYNVGYKEYIDLVAFGNISDSMSILNDETRYLCLEGIKKENLKNRTFKALINKHITEELTMKSIAWNVTPKINALIRVGSMEEKKMLIDSFINPTKRIEVIKKKIPSKINLSTHIVTISASAKRKQDTMVKKGLVAIEDRIDTSRKTILIKIKDEIPKVATGLVANKLASKYKLPTIILQPKKENYFGGSVRSPKNFGGIASFKEYLSNTNKFELCEGHPSAFGVEISENNINQVLDQIDLDFKDTVVNDEDIDYVMDAKSIDNNCIESVGLYEWLWGTDLPEPRFLIKDVEVNSEYINMMFNNTILTFNYDGIYYNKTFCSRDFKESLGYGCEENIISKIDIIGTFKIETYKGKNYYKVLIDKIIKKERLDE